MAKMIVDMIKEKNGQQKKPSEKVQSVVFEPNMILRNSTNSIELKKQVKCTVNLYAQNLKNQNNIDIN